MMVIKLHVRVNIGKRASRTRLFLTVCLFCKFIFFISAKHETIKA